MNLLPIIAVVILILLDQGTKLWALASLKPIHNMTLVEGFMDLTFVENRGVAFGMFSGQRWFILLLTGIIAVGLIWFYVTMPKKKEYFPLRVSLVMVLSGMARIQRGGYLCGCWCHPAGTDDRICGKR